MAEVVTFTFWIAAFSILYLLTVLNTRRFSTSILQIFERLCVDSDDWTLIEQIMNTYGPQVASIRTALGQHLAIGFVIVGVNIGTAYWAYHFQQLPLYMEVLCSISTATAAVALLNSHKAFKALQQTLYTVTEKSEQT